MLINQYYCVRKVYDLRKARAFAPVPHIYITTLLSVHCYMYMYMYTL